MKESPLTLLVKTEDGDFWRLMDDAIEICRGAAVHSRIKVGLPLGSPTHLDSVSMTPFEPKKGRRLTSTGRREVFGQKTYLTERMLGETQLVRGRVPPREEGYRNFMDLECVSFSAVSNEVAAQLSGLAEQSGMLGAALAWRPESPFAAHFLWHPLILKWVVAGEVVLRDYEGIPDVLRAEGNVFLWSPDRSPENADGFFFDELNYLSPEQAFLNIDLPADVAAVPIDLPRPTPLQRALVSVGSGPVLRPGNSIDALDENAQFSLPYPGNQYPDFLATEKKVRNYCLDPGHPEKKFQGFKAYGYGWYEPDSIVLAALICGALLEPFVPEEAVATSGGALTFSVGVSIPSCTRVRAPLTTVWIAEQDQSPRLVSAYISRGRSEYAQFPAMVNDGESLEDAWDSILDEARRLGESQVNDVSRARPRLYIERSGLANALTKRLVRQKADHGTFSRSGVGGRSLLVPVGPEMSWSGAALAASFAQIQLGLRGVRSMLGTWVD